MRPANKSWTPLSCGTPSSWWTSGRRRSMAASSTCRSAAASTTPGRSMGCSARSCSAASTGPADDLGPERHVMNGEAGRVKDRELIGGAAAGDAAEQERAEQPMDLPGVVLAAADRHVELAAMDRLRPLVHHDEGVPQDS